MSVYRPATAPIVQTADAAAAEAARNQAQAAAATAGAASSAAVAAQASATASANTASAAATTATTAVAAIGTSVTDAQTAATQAQGFRNTASTHATNAGTSATQAQGFRDQASTHATNAGASATQAQGFRDQASTHATNAGTSASNAATSATAAQTARTGAETALDEFDDRYLGSKASNPTLDNDGDALLTGALYWNTALNEMRVWSGTAWLVAYVPAGSAVSSFNGRIGAVIPQSGDYAVANITGLQTALDAKANLSHTHTAAQISDATAAGRALLTGADAAAQRTSLGLGALATAAGVTAAQISDATAAGRALLTGADAVAQRTSLGLGALATAAGVTAAQISDASANGRAFITAADYATMRSLISLVLGTTAEFRANTASRVLITDQVWSAAAIVTLTDGSTISLDLNSGVNFQVTLAGNRTLANPTNAKVGQTGTIDVIQDATGTRTLAFGNQYRFAGGAAPSLDTAASRRTVLSYRVRTATDIDIYLAGAGVR